MEASKNKGDWDDDADNSKAEVNIGAQDVDRAQSCLGSLNHNQNSDDECACSEIDYKAALVGLFPDV